MYEGDGLIHHAPGNHEIVRAAPQGSLVGRLADWFFDRVSSERRREVEDYIARATNERELSQRVHRMESQGALLTI
jgi:hypothetical protein